MDTERTLRELYQLPGDLAKALRRLAEAQVYATECKGADIVVMQENYDWNVAEATLEAMANGTCDGKNQAARDVQLAVALAKNVLVLRARRSLQDAESELRAKEAAVTTVEADVKLLSYQLRATMATAELWAAILNAGKKERDD